MSFKSVLLLKLYQVLTTLVLPLGMLFIAYKKRRDRPYGSHFFELAGCYNTRLPHCVWFHAASVGEVLSFGPLIKAFIAAHPHENAVLSTLTTTGATAAEKIEGLKVVIAPLDSPMGVRGFFKAFRPKALFIIDTELWPNFFHYANKFNCPVTLVNARMQEKNCLKYEKHKTLVKDLIASRLNAVSCKSRADADRFRRIGVDEEKISVTGNLKYDLTPDEDRYKSGCELKKSIPGQVLGAISTHDGEEEELLETFFTLKQDLPELNLVLVPRHRSGVENACRFLKERGEAFVRKSEKGVIPEFKDGILVGDTMGEIEFYFGLCDLVFMGGSFVDIGGHNPLEPAYFSLPVITGPSYRNFQEVYDRMIECHAAYLANDHRRLYTLVKKLLSDPYELKESGIKALEIQQEGRGALEKNLRLIEQVLGFEKTA